MGPQRLSAFSGNLRCPPCARAVVVQARAGYLLLKRQITTSLHFSRAVLSSLHNSPDWLRPSGARRAKARRCSFWAMSFGYTRLH